MHEDFEQGVLRAHPARYGHRSGRCRQVAPRDEFVARSAPRARGARTVPPLRGGDHVLARRRVVRETSGIAEARHRGRGDRAAAAAPSRAMTRADHRAVRSRLVGPARAPPEETFWAVRKLVEAVAPRARWSSCSTTSSGASRPSSTSSSTSPTGSRRCRRSSCSAWSRPELREESAPGWAAGERTRRLLLEPLDASATDALIRGLIRGAELADECPRHRRAARRKSALSSRRASGCWSTMASSFGRQRLAAAAGDLATVKIPHDPGDLIAPGSRGSTRRSGSSWTRAPVIGRASRAAP